MNQQENNKRTIQFAGELDEVKAKKDKTLSIKLGTQELSSEDSAFILDLFEKPIWLALCETEIAPDDLNVPEVMHEFGGKKSPSERLRSVIFVHWTQNKEKINKPFNAYYDEKMEAIITWIKDKLKPKEE